MQKRLFLAGSGSAANKSYSFHFHLSTLIVAKKVEKVFMTMEPEVRELGANSEAVESTIAFASLV